jgi:hypothetical protein
MAESSLLADAIVSDLTREANLDVLRLTYHDPSMIAEARDCSVLIMIEEGKSRHPFITANDLLRDYGCFRLITLAPQMHHLHVWDRYDMPISGMAQAADRAQGFSRENGNEVVG